MNEKFSLLLRRHILETADERPADGQIETVLRATSRSPQRRSWLVRARWLVDPAAPFENARVRYGAAALALLVVAMMVAILATGGGPAVRREFEGRWTATDPSDRSTQTLVVGDGRSPTVHLEDDFSIDCQRRGDPSTVFVADGVGEIQGDRLVVQFASVGCQLRLAPYVVEYSYAAATKTLRDDQSIEWIRAP